MEGRTDVLLVRRALRQGPTKRRIPLIGGPKRLEPAEGLFRLLPPPGPLAFLRRAQERLEQALPLPCPMEAHAGPDRVRHRGYDHSHQEEFQPFLMTRTHEGQGDGVYFRSVTIMAAVRRPRDDG